MYSHTKKVGGLGRYGTRVGRKIRNEVRKIEEQMRKPKTCPTCSKPNVKRKASGIWVCRSCNNTFTGKAYLPSAPKKSVEKAVHETSEVKSPKTAKKEKSEEPEVKEEAVESKKSRKK